MHNVEILSDGFLTDEPLHPINVVRNEWCRLARVNHFNGELVLIAEVTVSSVVWVVINFHWALNRHWVDTNNEGVISWDDREGWVFLIHLNEVW